MLEKKIREYLQYLHEEKGVSRNTELSYRSDLKKLAAFARDRGLLDLDGLDSAFLEDFLGHLRDMGLSERTGARVMGCVRGFLVWLGESWQISPRIPASCQVPRAENKAVRVLSLQEISALLEGPDLSNPTGRRDRAILELLCSAGLRSSQLTALRVRDIDLQVSCVIWQEPDGSDHMIPFGDRARRSLMRYLSAGRQNFKSPDDILFPARGGGQMSRQSLWKIVRKYAEAAGIEGSVSPARIRATLAAELLDNGASLESVREIMGHADSSTTRRYVRAKVL